MADALTHGRLVLGIGNGYQPYEFERFGEDLKDATAKTPASLTLNGAIKLAAAGEVDPASLPVLRARAAQLLAHPDWSVSIGARKSPRDADAAAATTRAQAVVKAIRGFARRDKAAEVAAWDAVKGAPRAAELGLGIVLNTGELKPNDISGPMTPDDEARRHKAPALKPKDPRPAPPKAPAPRPKK